ncbi:entericidin [Adhaeribacter arboris]|uniref:entericidin n=1 Tax=Adhaeribacter arboris TaxID=2072846 RepID=UPI000D11CF0C|nr:entericidin [Adhaeribacter arboris]
MKKLLFMFIAASAFTFTSCESKQEKAAEDATEHREDAAEHQEEAAKDNAEASKDSIDAVTPQ